MKDKSILITGAAQGLGAAYARHLASLQARIVVADINVAGAQDIAASIKDQGGTALAVGLDVTDPDQIRAAFSAAESEFGDVEVLVNNAGGVIGAGTTESLSLSDWNKTIGLCLTGTWLCCQAAIPAMKASNRGRIINIASTTIDRGLPMYMPHYIAAKGGIVSLTRALARELGPHNVTVNAVSPGIIAMNHGEQVSAAAEVIRGEQCIPRLGVPEDLVGAVAFFASDASAYVTGQVLNVDAGWALG